MKLKPYGLTQEDKEEPYVRIIPERVQEIIDLYRKNHVEFPWTETEREEQNFELRRTLR